LPVALSPHSARRTPPDRHHAKADAFKRPSKQPVHLVAPAATLARDQLGEGVLRLERDTPAELHIEVFIRDMLDMTALNPAQGREVRLWVPDKTDTVEIGG